MADVYALDRAAHAATADPKRLAVYIGHRIGAARARAGWTQSRLADELECDHSLISRYERGLRRPSLPTLYKLAAALGVPVTEFLP
ncbi:MAG TPA: helix-turn-helix transcriptional regulator, partial [Miltoncostaeaceae bacterium]|nr:helix-turn-helix transcriptional regulator [Miltoncostaeaceae bacterium]